jgi:hypothetical protein
VLCVSGVGKYFLLVCSSEVFCVSDPEKLAQTPISGGRWVGIVRSRTEATELVNKDDLIKASYGP